MFQRGISQVFKEAGRQVRHSSTSRSFVLNKGVRQAVGVTTLLAGGVTGYSLLRNSSSPIKTEGPRKENVSSSTLPIGTFPKPIHNVSEENIQAAKREIIQILGKDGVNDTPAELKSRSTSDWSPSPVDRTASLIVFPQSTEDVSAIMRICHARELPVTPFSGGTSLDGALAATRGGICIDFRRMNKVISVHKDDLDVVVQPAVGWQELNEHLDGHGLFFPVDPGPGAQIGGMIATGCSGTNAYRYGPMKDWVISTTVVLADGTVVKTRQRPRKSTAGYDLTRLIVGSSGTLGLVTEATLKVTSPPKNQQVAVIAFPSCQKAVNTVIEMIQTGLQTEACELLDETAMRASNDSGYMEREYKEIPTLFVKLAGSSQGAVDQQVSSLQALARRHGSESFDSSDNKETIEELWNARKTLMWNLFTQKRDAEDKFLSCDVAVPISQLSKIIDETNEKFEQAGLLGSCLGHVGDGNFHASVFYGESQKEAAESIILWCRRRGVELEGTVTGEHGVGLTLRDLVTGELGVNATDMMRRIKFALDPKCLLACDKVVRIEEGEDH